MSGLQRVKLSLPQKIFLNDLSTRFRAYVGGFGSGKTFVGCLDLGTAAAKVPGITQGYFSPTYPLIRDVFYSTMDEAAHSLGFRTSVKTGDREVDLYAGRRWYGKIICRSMEKPASIVGFKMGRGLVDEIDTLPTNKARDAWLKIIARLREEKPGLVNSIGVTSTPEGFRHVYNTFADNPGADYSMVQASTYANEAFLPDGYIQSLLDSYPAELISAYVDGEFVNLTSGTVYRCFDRSRNNSTETVRDDDELHIGMDFNVHKMAAKINVSRLTGFHCVDEVDGETDTPSMIKALDRRYPGRKITVYPDASGASGSTKGASVSDISLMRAAGYTVRVKSTNPRVKDRVLSVNKAFEDRAWWVNVSRCPVAARCLEQQAYDDNGEPNKKTGHDHSNDAFGYPIAYLLPVRKPTVKSFTMPGMY